MKTLNPSSWYRVLCTLFGVGLLLVSASQTAAAQTNPRTALVIEYHTTPGNWLAFRAAMRDKVIPRLDELKENGTLSSFHVYLSREIDAESWNAMAFLDFNGAAGLARWNSTRQERPAGLTQPELALTSAIESTPVSLVGEATADSAAQHPVLLVIPYKYLVTNDAYREYLDGYTVPQLKGWISAGILSSYSIVMDQYPAGRAWNAMLVLEYRSDTALAERDAVKTRTRAQLAHDPKWLAISKSKANIREELSLTVADDAERQ